MRRFLGNEKVSPQVRKRLLFGEVLHQEVNESFNNMKDTQKGRQLFYNVFAMKIYRNIDFYIMQTLLKTEP